jgi:hypothetical protein
VVSARTRRILTAVSLLYVAAVVYTETKIPVSLMFNALLATLAAPMVWLIWVFARASAHQHANRWARDIQRVHAGRPAPLPQQGVTR